MHKNSLSIALLGVVLSYAPGAWAWGGQGHRTIGAIADRLLSEPARTAVAQLLAGDLDKFGRPSGRSTLAAVANWADEISGTPAARPRWHYDDAPVCGSAARARYCPDGQCNSAQLERLLGVLADGRAAPRERNEALKWVVHLVGDIHQPLHAADNGDRGGNRVAVALAGVRPRGRETLHGAWDNELVRLALHARHRRQPPPDLEALVRAAGELGARAGQGSPQAWARESHELALSRAYQYPGFACESVPARLVVLDRPYQGAAEAVVRERLLLAGARLAATLNRILAPAAPASQPRSS